MPGGVRTDDRTYYRTDADAYLRTDSGTSSGIMVFYFWFRVMS
jgi:hypothetical protein